MMKRKEIAQETVKIMEQGYYEYQGKTVDIRAAQNDSEARSVLITPDEGAVLVRQSRERGEQLAAFNPAQQQLRQEVTRRATVEAILDRSTAGLQNIGVLNFASAKNPGGGFLNGAMAQEESLAASSGLYGTQLRNKAYYEANRECKSMMYTDHAIYSPDVVFFRNEQFELLETPVRASVLTLPAVNYGQVVLKGEDTAQAAKVMKDRMRLALAIFAHKGDKNLILGAYGCGVFRNNPALVAVWWKELLEDEGYGVFFDRIEYAVLDG